MLRDCLRQPERVRQLYALAVEAVEDKRKFRIGLFLTSPSSIVGSSIEAMQFFVGMLKKLRAFAEAHAARFESRGFTDLFAMRRAEFGDNFFASIHGHLAELKFSAGVLSSAELGMGNQGTNHVLRLLRDKRPHGLRRLLGKGPPSYTFHLAERDEAGARAFSELQDRGLNLAANALAQSTEHILGFFDMLRTELAFYVAALNLHDELVRRGAPICLPEAVLLGSRRLHCADLRDDGRRTFRLVEGEPLSTSHGKDLNAQVFGPDPAHAGPPQQRTSSALAVTTPTAVSTSGPAR
ncbi:MAG: hypothetical protein KGL43_12515 [Burkholderiales bacterium]|nr:hypothetical protein [Burkholderiales bacterium]